MGRVKTPSIHRGKNCPRCGSDTWYVSPKSRIATCHPCVLVKAKAYNAANSERARERTKQWRVANPRKRYLTGVRTRFGITPEKYASMLQVQGGVCAICKQPETAKIQGRVKELSVDHDHRTKKIRGLLCWTCNTTLGKVKDQPKRLRMMADYLERHQ